mmetsp:Transcript_21438/g.24643  ORF Transcript_21438/g.24643 Transcript_21438/m.24643 type:complete len:116 (+) Transcript_21438:26-373(+)
MSNGNTLLGVCCACGGCLGTLMFFVFCLGMEGITGENLNPHIKDPNSPQNTHASNNSIGDFHERRFSSLTKIRIPNEKNKNHRFHPNKRSKIKFVKLIHNITVEETMSALMVKCA